MVPGAGTEPIEPYQVVLKDGFSYVDCFKDYMLYFGDKFGDHKWDYALGPVSNVSIVLYSEIVPKQDRTPMSAATCFAFCRTVPDMVFFGVNNGRECYCMPYLRQMAGDSSQCDAVCEGDTGTTCGGKTKSSVFEMHMCQQTFTDMTDAKEAMEKAGLTLASAEVKLTAAAQEMKGSAEDQQAACGQAGDISGSALAQAAKVRAGVLLEAAGAAKALSSEIEGMKGKADGMATDNSDETVTAAESLTKEMQEATAKAAEGAASLATLLVDASPDLLNMTSSDTANLTSLYKDVMYFVDKSHLGVPSSCGGVAVGDPMTGTLEGCVKACQERPRECVGFQWFSHDLCFLFSKLQTLLYYTGCEVKEETVCMVKFSEFVGTTLKPDPSGKCAGCLTTAEEAARCLP
jgi:hypothetical protein